MDRDHARVNVVAGTVALVVVGVLLAAVYYGVVTRADPVRCLFGDAPCSQTAATYLLALLTAGAFYATYRAVLYTKKSTDFASDTLQQSKEATENSRRSYENSLEVFRADRTPVMTLQRCSNIDDATLFADPGHMPERDRRHGHLDADILEYFLNDLAMPKLATAPPRGCDLPVNCVTPADRRRAYPYDPWSFDILSLGRVPFINGYLYLDIVGRPEPLRVYVGSVAPNDYVHIVIWIRKQLGGRGKIEWSKTATDDSPELLKYWPPPFEFFEETYDFAEDVIETTFDYEKDKIEPEKSHDDDAPGAPLP